jgi:hypothetical protein
MTSTTPVPGLLTTTPASNAALASIDTVIGPDDSREPQRMFEAFGISRSSRFAYQAQPSLSIIWENLAAYSPDTREEAQHGIDLSMHFLFRDVEYATDAGIFDANTLEKLSILYLPTTHRSLSEHPVQPLTYVDAYAALPRSARSKPMLDWVSMITHLWGKLWFIIRGDKITSWSQQNHNVPDLYTRMTTCLLWVLLRRLTFYVHRKNGHTLEEFQSHMERLRYELRVTADWTLTSEITEIRDFFQSRRRDLQEEMREPAKMKWDGEPISVGQLSIPVSQDDMDGDNCAICCDTLTPPAVHTVVCGHSYCQECLQTWVQACQPNSHTCPVCRRQLFPKPEYQLDKEYIALQQRKFQNNENLLGMWNDVSESADWLTKELDLQQRCDREIELSRSG